MPRTQDRKVGNAISYGNVFWALALSGYGAFRLLGPGHNGPHLILATVWYWFLIAAGVVLALIALLAHTVRHDPKPATRKLDDAQRGM